MKAITISKFVIVVLVIFAFGCKVAGSRKEIVTSVEVIGDSHDINTFTNPLLPSGADPWAIYHKGNYYYIKSGANAITLMRTPDITDLKNAEKKIIWTAPNTGDHSKNIWAPEVHNIDGFWYVYVAADDGDNRNHRMFVLENRSADPFEGEFIVKSKLRTDPNDNWAIDGSIFRHKDKFYFIWSGWEKPKAKIETQNIYIARMSDPWTITSERVLLSTPEFDWERNWEYPDVWHPDAPVYVNEGPQALAHGSKLHIIYSASGCWTPYYALGILSMDAESDPMDLSSWKKSKEPIFQQSLENRVYGTGHNSFFKSPDGTEDWVLYHANDNPTDGCAEKRSPRAQKISWSDDDMPILGIPLPTSKQLAKPSGTNK
ncbi:glycoside hydrolase family 43 protein [Maribacter polysiphoniae]|uniref:GH43 family beta-xylosidase n=1 Tax=Maribacter polysiphoniae TaxID=429344 RepID=A0A316E2J7_9FLAO|nr:glycoside hydrolase family 43 protein [Maribacter polysiphoniae]MBD1260560.1 glycoside hydrolase family 43 protein [Maribacter polysiphoniae]PWK24315.1 GH43 family beta-xylosidase [Maribacter polysiphoniae]